MSADKILEKHSPIFNPLFADDNVKRWKKDIIAAMEEYATAKAKASCEATLIKASENASLMLYDYYVGVCKSSILDPSNIVIVP